MKISVLIPTFNRSKALVKALNSVLSQTYKPYEIIVVDDGSADDTFNRIKIYGNKINYVRRENSGKPGIARNTGLKHVTGDWVAFLDSDDIWEPNKLELQRRFIEKSETELSLVFSDYLKVKNIEESNRPVVITKKDLDIICSSKVERGIIFKKDLFYYYLLYKNPIHTSSVMMNRKALDSIGGFDESLTIAEDRDLWIRCARVHHVGYIHDVLCKYCLEKDNITEDSILYLSDLSRVISKYYRMERRFIPDDMEAEIKIRLGKVYRTLSLLKVKNGLKHQGITAMLCAMKYSKISIQYLFQMVIILISPKLYEYIKILFFSKDSQSKHS